ncbi:Uncharacterized protein APZ42_007773 [Daphnia magna]|uniref:Reverse transcriptase domain-containing protein n=1 Tax=Daphnia magna TaxID=35525 RepID=A0A164F3G7_9CRUS|nr:Uncharacterized protein APZ42_007773 [Daphnia magna]
MFQLLEENLECFAANASEVGRCNISEHNIETGDSPPIHQAPYASAWKARTIVNEQVKSLEEVGIIEISDSSWSAPVVLIRKKDGTWRFCVDYRKLNSVTVRDVYPLPRIADVLSRLEGAEFFSILYLQAGYHQIPVREEDRHKTAFITADGLYQCIWPIERAHFIPAVHGYYTGRTSMDSVPRLLG